MFSKRLLRWAAALAFRDAWADRRNCALLVACLAVAIAGMDGMQLVAVAFARQVSADFRQWIAADAIVRRDVPPLPGELDEVRGIAPGIRTTLVTEVGTLASSSQAANPVAVRLKAVNPAEYPFYGHLLIQSGGRLADLLDSNSAMIDEDLAEALRMRPGGTIRIHEAEFQVRGIIAAEPDRFAGPYTPDARVLVSQQGLERTGLMRFNDRAFYRILVRTPPEVPIVDICRRLQQIFPDGEIGDFTAPLPVNTVTFDLLVPFLNAASVLSLALGLWSVAVLSRLHLLRRLDTIAILKSLGANWRQIAAAYLLEVLVLTLVGSIAGLAGGHAIRWMCARVIVRQLGVPLPAVSGWAWEARTLLLAVLAGCSVAGASLVAIRKIRPSLLLRREVEDARRLQSGIGWGMVFGAPAVLLFCAGDFWETRLVVVILAVAVCGLFRVAGRICTATLASIRTRRVFALRHGLANLHRYSRQTGTTIPLLAAAVTLLLIARAGGHQIWDRVVDSFPFGVPNLLVFKVAPDEVPLVRTLVEQHRPGSPLVLLPNSPVTIGSVDGAGLDLLRTRSKRGWVAANWFATCSDTQPAAIQVMEGKWWQPGEAGPAIAFEQGLASQLGAHANSEVELLASGKPLRARVAAVVHVPPVNRIWYRLTMNCGVFEHLPGIHFSGGAGLSPVDAVAVRAALQDRLRTATVVEANDVRRRAQQQSAEADGVVSIISAVLALMACALLLAITAAQRPFRVGEIAVLRALGASTRRLLLSMLVEYLVLGGIAGLLGGIVGLAACSMVLSFVTGRREWVFEPATVPLAIAAASLLSATAGVAGLLSLLRTAPLKILRGQ